MKKDPKCIFEWNLQESTQKEIINHAEVNLCFNGIDRGELGVVNLLIEIFKIICNMYWLQENEDASKILHLFQSQAKSGNDKTPTAHKEMRFCHSLKSKFLAEASQSVEDVLLMEKWKTLK